ncbi:MAG: alcohol dehydrogenase catalytic domain-containing protein [Mycobacteriales bacterium]
MKAMVFEGAGARSWTDVPDATLREADDLVLEVEAVTICGTDLHILKGDVPEVQPGTVLGHEAVGRVVAVGAGVRTVEVGDRVLASCITCCGVCPSCRAGSYGLCTRGGGWVLGHTIDGVQADYARIPHADLSVHRLPEPLSDERAVLLADILPTAYEVGVVNGALRPGDVVAVVGAGPIGLAAIATAQLVSPLAVVAVDPVESRREAAKRLGADVVAGSPDEALAAVQELTGGLGAQVVVEAVGVPDTFELCTRLVRSGGHVANVGVHGKPAVLHLEELWARDVTITTGLVDTVTTPTLLALLAAGKLDVSGIVTHRFALAEMEQAYQAFEAPDRSDALKVVAVR